MLPYDDCQQHTCWIVRFFRASNLPFPRFFIHQRVFADYFDDETATIERTTGVIVGLVYKSPGQSKRIYVPGWYYLVRWDDVILTRNTSTYVEVCELELAAEIEPD